MAIDSIFPFLNDFDLFTLCYGERFWPGSDPCAMFLARDVASGQEHKAKKEQADQVVVMVVIVT